MTLKRATAEQITQADDDTAPRPGRVGGGGARLTPVQRRYGMGAAPVQRRAAEPVAEREPEQVQAEAAAGVQGAGGSLPYLEQIQAAFDPFDIGGIQAHVGGAAATSARAIGAEAYATGDHVAFEKFPDLHTAAHEAAHVVQQRAGVQLLGGVGEVGDPYELQADAVADRVVAGQSASDLLAGSPAKGSTTRAVQASKPKGGVYTVNNDPTDVITGLLPKEEQAVQALIDRVRDSMAAWRAKRTTPELGFRTEGSQLSADLRKLRVDLSEINGVMLVGDTHRAVRAAAQRLRSESYLRYMQEIRAFNPGALPEYQRILGFDDIECEHTYQLEPVVETTTGLQSGGAGVGYSTRQLKIHYACKQLGLSWTQTIDLAGFKLSFGISKDTITGKGKPSVGGSVAPPGGPTPAVLQPSNAYLPPSFFGDARYTQVGASAKASVSAAGLGGGGAGVGRTIMKISNPDRFAAGPQLTWDSGWGPEVEGSVGVSEMPDGEAPDLDADFNVGVDTAGWSATLQDQATLKGSLGEVDDKVRPGAWLWTPLHMARVYFGTGDARLTFEALDIMQRLAQEVKERDEKEQQANQRLNSYMIQKRMFKIEIASSYSNRWSQHDPELERLEEREAAGKATKRDERKKNELETVKLAENEALAFDRATSARDAIFLYLGTEGITVARKAISDDFTCEAPLSEEKYDDRAEDRWAEVRVSSKLWHPFGGEG